MTLIVDDGLSTFLGANPMQGPEITPTGTRLAAFWDPAPGNYDNHGNQIFYGTGPLYSENPWDLVYLNAQKLPGICAVKCRARIKVDKQKGSKSDGARHTLHGYDPGPLEITVTIWTQEQWQTFVDLVPSFWRKQMKSPKELKDIAKHEHISMEAAKQWQAASYINHPATDMMGIGLVLVTELGPPEPGPVAQAKTIKLQCVEVLPPTRETSPSKISKAKRSNAKNDSRSEQSPSKTAVGPAGDAGSTKP